MVLATFGVCFFFIFFPIEGENAVPEKEFPWVSLLCEAY